MSSAGGPFTQPAGAYAVAVAPERDQSGTVLSLGLLLVAVNVLTTENGLALVNQLTGLPVSGLTRYTPAGSWVSIPDIALQLLMVALLAGFARTGEGAGSLALTFMGALWLLWALQHLGLLANLSTAGAPSPRTAFTPPTSGGSSIVSL